MGNILKFLDPFQVERNSAVCRYWFLLCREADLWKSICLQIWPGQEAHLSNQVQKKLQGNWRRLFLDKPRPRLDGVYISQNSYVRSGQTEGVYDQPVHKVRYWRYLRFFDDGSVLSICTPAEPKKVVPVLTKQHYLEKTEKAQLEEGIFEIIEGKKITDNQIRIHITQKRTYSDIIRNRTIRRNCITDFCFVLKLSSSFRGWHDRLI